jgi:hypothetical protein
MTADTNTFDYRKSNSGAPDRVPSGAPADGGMATSPSNTAKAFDRFKDSATTAASDLKDTAAAATNDARVYAGSLASDAAGAFKDAVESNKTAGAEAIVSLARSAKSAADSIEKQSPQVAGAVRSAAEGVERISQDIRDRSVGELMDSVTDFAKRQPATFFGVGILAGIILTRFMRTSSHSA